MNAKLALMHCRLLIPDLFPPDPAFAEPLRQRQYSHLETLIARARRGTDAWHSIEQWLLEIFSVERQQDWPSAPFALLGDGGNPGEAFWMHAEPINLRPDRDRVLLADSSLLDVSLEEAEALALSVNGHFAAELHLLPVRANRWYARLSSPPAQPTVPLSAVLGQAVRPGSASIGWHALMNEIQMLLHEHPVNEAREARGAPAINGIWLWGGGRLVEAKAPPLRTVLSDYPLALGLASKAGVRASYPPEDVGRWLDGGEPDGVQLAVLVRLTDPARHREVKRWAGEVQSLERRWFAPLFEALQHGRIGMVSMHLGSEAQVLNTETTRSDLRHFWRLRRPLAHYCAAK
jgi:hypothetical protein